MKNGEVLSNSDDRIKLTKSGSLVFSEVRQSDSGEYVCQVSTIYCLKVCKIRT